MTTGIQTSVNLPLFFLFFLLFLTMTFFLFSYLTGVACLPSSTHGKLLSSSLEDDFLGKNLEIIHTQKLVIVTLPGERKKGEERSCTGGDQKIVIGLKKKCTIHSKINIFQFFRQRSWEIQFLYCRRRLLLIWRQSLRNSYSFENLSVTILF